MELKDHDNGKRKSVPNEETIKSVVEECEKATVTNKVEERDVISVVSNEDVLNSRCEENLSANGQAREPKIQVEVVNGKDLSNDKCETQNGNGVVTEEGITDKTTRGDDGDKVYELNDYIGELGKWHWWILIIGIVEQVMGPANILAVVFMAPEIDFWCSRPPEFGGNVSVADWANLTGRPTEINDDKGRCWRHELDSEWWNATGGGLRMDTNRTVRCTDWEYDHSIFRSTIVEEWSLVCDRSWLVSLSQTLFMAGFLAACLILGPMADWFGRRPVFSLSAAMFLVSGIVCAFSPNYLVYGLSRFFVAFGRTGASNTLFVLMMETLSSRCRSTVSLVTGFAWNFGLLALSGLAYVLPDWFLLQVVLASASVLLVVFGWFLPESPRWLLTNGHLSRAAQTMKRAASLNGVKVTRSFDEVARILSAQQCDSSSGKRYSVLDLMRTPNMRKKTILLYILWALISFVFYGLSLNLGDMGGDLFLNNAIVGSAQIPIKVVTLFAVKSKLLGRKYTLITLVLAAGLCCFAIIPASNGDKIKQEFTWLRVTLCVLAISLMTTCFSVLYIQTAELFPTTVRSLGLTSCSVCARFGSMLAPFTKELGESNQFMIPLGLFGVVCMVCVAMVLPQPETNGTPLPETLEAAEDFGKKKLKNTSKETKSSDKTDA